MTDGFEPSTTWRALWRDTEHAVGDRTSARWLCETASATTGAEFLTILDETPTVRMVAHLDAMVARVRTGEPLQYALGEWAFRRLHLAIDRRVLIPRPETELVAERARDLAASRGPIRTVVDLGTGSGAIGLALADELPVDGTTVWLTDVSDDALDVARANLAGIGRAAANVRVAAGSWFDALPRDLRADVIVSNPPYVATGSTDLAVEVAEWEPASALFAGDDGLDDIRMIVAGALDRLRPGGWLVFEIGANQGTAVIALLAEAGFVDVEVSADLAGHDRIAVGRRRSTIVGTDVDIDGSTRHVVIRHLRNELADAARLLQWLRASDDPGWRGGGHVDLGDVLQWFGPGSAVDVAGTVTAITEFDGDPVALVVARHDDDAGWSHEILPGDDAALTDRLRDVIAELVPRLPVS